MNEVQTTAGTVSVKQTSANEIEIVLTSSPEHPGIVTVSVTNSHSGDTVKLTWIK